MGVVGAINGYLERTAPWRKETLHLWLAHSDQLACLFGRQLVLLMRQQYGVPAKLASKKALNATLVVYSARHLW